MTTRSEDVLLQGLTDSEALNAVVESAFDLEAIPTMEIRKIVKWAIEYYADSDFAMPPSREALEQTWGEDIRRLGIDLLPDDEDSDTIQWALKDLNSRYANAQFQMFQRSATARVAEADPTQKVSEIVSAASELMNLSNSIQAGSQRASGALGIKQAIAKQRVRSAQDSLVQGLTLGLEDLDDNLLGIREGELCIAMGAQASGKSLLSVMAALDNWNRGKNVCLITLENSLEMTWDRLLVAGVNRFFADKLRDAGVEPLEMRDWMTGTAEKVHKEAALEFLDMMEARDTIHVSMPARGSRTPEAIVNAARMVDADVLIIDQLTFLEYSGRGNKPKHEQMGDMLHDLKSLISANARPIPCLLLHQLNREGIKNAEKTGTISAYNAADSAEVERTADVLLAIYQSRVEATVDQARMLCLKYRRGFPKDYLCEWDKGHLMARTLREIEEMDDASSP